MEITITSNQPPFPKKTFLPSGNPLRTAFQLPLANTSDADFGEFEYDDDYTVDDSDGDLDGYSDEDDE